MWHAPLAKKTRSGRDHWRTALPLMPGARMYIHEVPIGLPFSVPEVVGFWHTPEDFGGASIPSGYRVTFTVPLSKAACGLVTRS